MNIRNMRVQEANRIRSTVQRQMYLNQTFNTAGGQTNGYRSLGFYQASRYTSGNNQTMIVGSIGGGTTVGP